MLVGLPMVAANGASADQAPEPSVEGAVNGAEAVEQLGSDLPAVAASVDMTAGELKQELLADDDLHVDAEGSLLYVDTDLAPPSAATEPQAAGLPAVADLADTFTLHSKAGSQRVIYLDFDGFEVTGSSWNGGVDFTADAYDSDGNATFSDAEKGVAQEVWRRMAEDFSTFDVDVTTEDPGQAAITRSDASDLAYGTRLVITNTQTIQSTCGCGGIAYLGVFNSTSGHASHQPAFVFTYGPFSKGAKFIAEAGSHEVGHNLGLAHDGQTGTPAVGYYSGHSGWAPIMGVGYSQAVTQWSKGEYGKANNKQDDLTVMQTYGLPLLTDETGDKAPVASHLGDTSSTALTTDGFITTAKDVDLYGFNAGAGQLTVGVAVNPTSPNLDVELQLLTATGKKVTLVNAADQMGASLTATVTEGTYYVRIDGAKNGSAAKGWSDYASVGAYSLSVTGVAPSGSAPNLLPKASIVSSVKVIGVPGHHTLYNTGSYDPDGWLDKRAGMTLDPKSGSSSWTFGKTGTTGSTIAGPWIMHSFSSEITSYTATLTVTDLDGAKATKTVVYKTLPAMTVTQMTSGYVSASGKTNAAMTVKVVDAAGAPLAGAAVKLNWTGAKAGSGTGKTAADGTIKIKGPLVAPTGGNFTVTVATVTLKNYAYNGEYVTDTVVPVTSATQSF